MEVPPAIAILVFVEAWDGWGAGEEAREDFAEEMSEIRAPVAEGGSLGVCRDEVPEVAVGTWRASGFSCRASVFAKGGSFLPFDLPDI